MKKIFSILWGISIVALSTISCTFAYTQEQKEAYQWAYKYGITTQPTIEKANLDWNLTRQAFSKMVVNYLEKAVWIKQTNSISCSFPDESKFSNELRPYAKKTCAYNIMWENWINFNPTQSVNRAQLWTVLSRILRWGEYNASGKDYYIYHLNALKFNGIMNKIDNPQANAKRWDVMIMLKRLYEKYGSDIYMNWSQNTAYNNNTTNKTSNEINRTTSKVNETTNNNEKFLTQEKVQWLIEKEEWLKEWSLSYRWYECYWEDCTYEFEYSSNWERYIYSRSNKISDKTKKVQDLWSEFSEEIALKDAGLSINDAEIYESFSSDWYIFTITTKDNVFIYSMTLDWKIKEKKTLITEEKALETILKEIKLEKEKSNIKKNNEDICSLSFNETYQCSFTYWWKLYTSYINAKGWTFIPIKKTAWGIQYWKSITWTENVIISEIFTYIDYDEAEELLAKKYNIEEQRSSWTRKIWEGKNAIYIYTVDDSEYYIDATNWTKMNSKDEIIDVISKDSWISKNIIKNSKNNDDDDEMDAIIENGYIDIETNEIHSIYSFSYEWITYTYKIRNIDWKILSSKKDNDIWKDKAVALAKKAIQKKYSPELQEDDYEIFNWNRAYIRYLSSSSTDELMETPYKTEPEYVVCFIDKSEENIYRVIVKYDGDIESEDKASIEEMGSNILIAIFYVMWYDINDIKDTELEFWWSFSF